MSTLKKIAEFAGVSQATVSRVLNNPDYRCSTPEKREKIWQAAMELHYVPNEAAKNLKLGSKEKKKKTYYIGILMTRTESADTDPFFTELLHVIETEVHRHFCVLSQIWYLPLFSDQKKCRGENLKRTVKGMTETYDGRIDGLIVIGKCSRTALASLEKVYGHIVAVNRNPSGYEVDEVFCDGRRIASAAVEYLVSLGHRRIAYVGECQNESRYQGYLDVLKKYGIETDLSYIYETKQTEEEGYEIMNHIAQSDDLPTAIYCANDITAVGMLKCLRKSRNRYLALSIISSDDIEEAQFTTPMLTTIGLPKNEMGKFSVYLLLDRIRGGHKSAVKMSMEGKLVKRESCRDVRDTVDYYI